MTAAPDDAGPDGPDAIAILRRELEAERAAHAAARAREVALAEVMAAINANPGDLMPVFDTILEKAMALCGAAFGTLMTHDESGLDMVASRGIPDALMAYRERQRPTTTPGSPMARVLAGGQVLQVPDMMEEPAYRNSQPGQPGVRAIVDLGGARSAVFVPLVKDGAVRGIIIVYRQVVSPFTDKQVALLQSFAAQAVIAMENARLVTETRKALERQTATADILRLINKSPENLQPVFDAILEKAHRLCDAEMGALAVYDAPHFRPVASLNYSESFVAALRRTPPETEGNAPIPRLVAGESFVHVPDVSAPDVPEAARLRLILDHTDLRTLLFIALRKDGRMLGFLTAHRRGVRPYADDEIDLLRSFADQAVVAMENARLITEQQEALEQQTATAEVLGVINASPGNLTPVFDAILEKAMQLCGVAFGSLNTWDGKMARNVANRGLPPALIEWQQRNQLRQPASDAARLIETRGPRQVLDTREGEGYRAGHAGPQAMVDLGGARTSLFIPLVKDDAVLGFFHFFRQEIKAFSGREIALLENFAAQAVIAMENARLLNEIRAARDEAETMLADLQRTQDRLVQTEKMASLGQLTAGIAHEIKNPLNFVNNFSDLSADLLDELNEAVAPGKVALPEDTRAEIDEITETLKGNLQKIAQHGRRADSIVKNMLLHSRTGASERREADLNTVAEEALNLAYHGARAETPGFNITLEKDLDHTIGAVEIFPQEISRVLVNLVNNGFYAAHSRAQANPGFEPALRLRTRNLGEQVEIRVRDNGTGIPADVREKIFEPFFTTKPAGQGTGLGLSLSFDIIVKQHGGHLSVESEPDAFTEFTITLPRRLTTAG